MTKGWSWKPRQAKWSLQTKRSIRTTTLLKLSSLTDIKWLTWISKTLKRWRTMLRALTMRYALLIVKRRYRLMSSVKPPFEPQAKASQCLGSSICARRSAGGGKPRQSKLTPKMALTSPVFLTIYLDNPCVYCCNHYLRMYHSICKQMPGVNVSCSYLYHSWQRFLRWALHSSPKIPVGWPPGSCTTYPGICVSSSADLLPPLSLLIRI